MRTELAAYAKHGWVLVPIPRGQKGPVTRGWQRRENCITDPAVAAVLDGNVGLAHAYSKTCSIDIDDKPHVARWLADRGKDLEELLRAKDAVQIISREGRAKLLYAMPKPRPSVRLADGKLELRCGTSTGTTVQDVLPPSIHPDTGKPYRWHYNSPMAHWSNLPPLHPVWDELWKPLVTPRSIARANNTPAKLSELEAILAQHDPDCGYEDWIEVGFALHHDTGGSAAGFQLWDEWSTLGKTYPGTDKLAVHWKSFRSDHPNPVTLASLRITTPAADSEFRDLRNLPQALPAPAPAVTPVTPLVVAEAAAQDDEVARAAASEAIRELRRDANGRVLPWVSNVRTVLMHPVHTGMQIAYDSFIDNLVLAPHGFDEWRQFTDNDYTRIRAWLETRGGFGPVGVEIARSATHLAAEARTMDSAQMWLCNLQWDGIERVEHFVPRYWGGRGNDYELAVGKYLWTALAARVMDPGCQVDMVPILFGDQGVGKSSGVRAMVPDVSQYTTLRLDEPDDAAARKLRGVLVVELAELRGLNTVEIERIKEFLTRTHERLIPKFKEHAVNMPRRCLFIGTTNNHDALPRDGANRRFLPIETTKVDVAAIIRDREQLWAEGFLRWQVNGVEWAEASELGSTARHILEQEDVWTDSMAAYVEQNKGQPIRIREMLMYAIGLELGEIRYAHERRAAQFLAGLGYERKTLRLDGRVTKAWLPKS